MNVVFNWLVPRISRCLGADGSSLPQNKRVVVKKMKLYIVRVGTYGELKDSRPCLNCFNTIKNLGIKKIIYSTNDSSIVSQYSHLVSLSVV